MEKKIIDEEARFQDGRTDAGGKLRKFQHLISEEHPYLYKRLGDVKDKRILIMGCATGGVTPIARLGGIVTGVDISMNSLKKLYSSIVSENLIGYASVILCDCEELALSSEVFDVVIYFGSLHHLDIEKTLGEAHRVLKPGGKVLMAEPLGLHPIINLYRVFTPNLRTKAEHPLLPKDFHLMKNKFVIEEVKSFCLFSIFSLLVYYGTRSEKVYEYVRRKLNEFDCIVFENIPYMKYYSWSAVIVLKKK